MKKLEALKNLRTVLASLYEKPEDAERVAEDSGLNTINIDFTDSMINIWREILLEAHKEQKVEALITAASQDYASRSTELQRSYGAYITAEEDGEEFDDSPSRQSDPSTGKPTTAESTPNRFPTLWIGVLGAVIVLVIVAILWQNRSVNEARKLDETTEGGSSTTIPISTSPTSATCAFPVAPALAGNWQKEEMGCPIASLQTVWSAWVSFERGYMLWRLDTKKIYVFPFDKQPYSFADEWDQHSSIPNRGTPPSGKYAPESGIGWLWGNEELVFKDLGWATNTEKGFCAQIQTYESGFLLQGGKDVSCRDGLGNSHTTSEVSFPVQVVSNNGA